MDQKEFWDYVSVGVVGFILFYLIKYVETGDTKYLWYFLGTIITDLLTKIIKHLTSNMSTADVFKRPVGAFDCDIFCRNGSCEGKPGFPSGHVATAAFVITTLLLSQKRSSTGAFFSWFIGVLMVSLIAMSRLEKKCHNIQQVVVGLLIGSFMGYVFTCILDP